MDTVRRRPQRLAEPEFAAVHEADARRQRRVGAHGLEERHAVGKAAEDERPVPAFLRLRMNRDQRLRNHAEVTFAAEQQRQRLHAGRRARRRTPRLDGAGRRDERRLDDDVLDIAVAVLLHAAGVGGDPPAQRREFETVRRVSGRVAEGAERLFEISAGDPRLDERAAVRAIDRQHAAHPAHVDRHDRARLLFGAHERAAHVRAAAERHQARAVFDRRGDDRAHFRFVHRLDDDVGDAGEASAVEQTIDFADGELAVAMREADDRIRRPAPGREQALERRHQRLVEARRGHLRRGFRHGVRLVERHAEHLLDVRNQVRHRLAAQ